MPIEKFVAYSTFSSSSRRFRAIDRSLFNLKDQVDMTRKQVLHHHRLPQAIARWLQHNRFSGCVSRHRFQLLVGTHFGRLLDSIPRASAHLQQFVEYQRAFVLVHATGAQIHFVFEQFDGHFRFGVARSRRCRVPEIGLDLTGIFTSFADDILGRTFLHAFADASQEKLDLRTSLFPRVGRENNRRMKIS